MDFEKHRLNLAEEIAKAWNENKLLYAVVHGLYDYPSRIGRDLDIVTLPEEVPILVKVALRVARKLGFPEALFRWSHWGLYQLVLIDEFREISLPIDFLCTTDVWRAKLIPLMDQQTLKRIVKGDAWLGPFRVSTEGHFIKVCLRSLLCGDLRKFWKEYPLPIKVPNTISEKYLQDTLGNYGLKLLKKNSLDELFIEYPYAVRKIQYEWCKAHFLKCFLQILKAFKGKIGRYFLDRPVLVLLIFDKDIIKSYLEDISKNMKRLFVELRFKQTSKYNIPIFEKIINPPISEFVVVVYLKKSKESSFSDSMFDLKIELRNLTRRDVYKEIKNNILEYLLKKYKVPFIQD